MSELGVIKTKDGKRLFVEVEELRPGELDAVEQRPSDLPDGAELTGVGKRAVEEVQDGLAQLRDNIELMAEQVHQAFQARKPQEWTMEVSIGFKGKVNPIPFIAGGEADAALKVSATWKEDA